MGAGEVLAEHQRLGLGVLAGVAARQHLDHRDALGELERRLDRVGQPPAHVLLLHQAVDHDLDVVLDLLLELGDVGDVVDLTVDPDARVALGGQLLEQRGVLALAAAHDRREHLEAGAGGELVDLVDDLLGGLGGDAAAAVRAVRLADPCVEQPEVVVDLGDGPDRRARVARGRLLVDRDRRRQALDEVDVGLVHLPQELPGVGGQRLDVAALALGVDRVEGEARLARAGQAGEDDQRVPRQLEADVLQVVLTGTADGDRVGRQGGGPSWCVGPASDVRGGRRRPRWPTEGTHGSVPTVRAGRRTPVRCAPPRWLTRAPPPRGGRLPADRR